MDNLTLNLTLEEINTVLEALGQMPYVRVYQLILKIQQQSAPQLSHAKPPEGTSGKEQEQ